MKKTTVLAALVCMLAADAALCAQRRKRMTPQETLDAVLQNTKPLKFDRGDRLPLILWTLRSVATDDDAKAEAILKDLDSRGIPVISSWSPHPKRRDGYLASALRMAKLQKKLGLDVIVDANRCMSYFFDGSQETAHVTEAGERFFDMSFRANRKMGCPFAVKERYPAIKEQFKYFLDAYKENGLEVDMLFLDWEIDGPTEWNEAWAHSKRCKRCRDNIPNINDFRSFQRTLRAIRCEMQREVCVQTVQAYFPKALIGNYSVYEHNGYRYWYDYYEKFVDGAPFQADGRAKYREWYPEMKRTGYTMGMPVVYPWAWTYQWYDFANGDYRWFYNMLKVASNACEKTPASIPNVSFVHWQTVWCMPEDPSIKQFSEQGYKELLWHMLLRGTDGLFLWCPQQGTATEVGPLHEVYAASLQYREFLDKGVPISFDVPAVPAPVVSGLRLGDKVLVRRTDFASGVGPIQLTLSAGAVAVPECAGQCQVLPVTPR